MIQNDSDCSKVIDHVVVVQGQRRLKTSREPARVLTTPKPYNILASEFGIWMTEVAESVGSTCATNQVQRLVVGLHSVHTACPATPKCVVRVYTYCINRKRIQ